MNQLARTNEVWLDRDNKILSFHYVKDYLHKQFKDYVSFVNYVVWSSKSGYKIQ